MLAITIVIAAVIIVWQLERLNDSVKNIKLETEIKFPSIPDCKYSVPEISTPMNRPILHHFETAPMDAINPRVKV